MALKGFNSKAVHAGDLRIPQIGNVVTPIFENSTFEYPNDNKDAYMDKTRDLPYIYSRWGNPTIQSLEEKYACLDHCEYGLAFSSGMAAITSAILGTLKKGDNLLSINELYGQTFYFFSNILKNYGINVDFISVDDLNELKINKKNYKAIYIESITNPLLEVPDIIKISKYCKENNIILIDDATFASPYNQNPIDSGADIVVHSGTKYISGHSDLLIGLIGTSKDYYKNMVTMRKTLGAIPDAFQSYLAYRGLKTLGLRMEKHNENGNKISEFLNNSENVITVYYPGLNNNKYNKIASKNMRYYGGMVSFKLKGDINTSHKFIKNLKIPAYAASLGGVESLITLPVETTHSSLSIEDRNKTGITDNLIRLSLGIEDYEDLIDDFNNSLNKL